MIEVLVAMFVLSTALLGLVGAIAGAARLNRESIDRQKALEVAASRIADLRSMEFADVALLNNTGQDDVDYERNCPRELIDCDARVAQTSTTLANGCPSGPEQSWSDCPEPRRAKTIELLTGKTASSINGTDDTESTVLEDGVVVYTYITRVRRTVVSGTSTSTVTDGSYKLATVVVKFRDAPDSIDTSTDAGKKRARDFTTVRISSAIVASPGLDIEKFVEPSEDNR